MLAENDEHHAKCVEVSRTLAQPLFTCWPVLTEAACLLRTEPNAFDILLSKVQSGHLRILSLDVRDFSGILAINRKYYDQSFDFADICIMHLAERESIKTVFTVDRKDFLVFRTTTGESLRILPE